MAGGCDVSGVTYQTSVRTFLFGTNTRSGGSGPVDRAGSGLSYLIKACLVAEAGAVGSCFPPTASLNHTSHHEALPASKLAVPATRTGRCACDRVGGGSRLVPFAIPDRMTSNCTVLCIVDAAIISFILPATR